MTGNAVGRGRVGDLGANAGHSVGHVGGSNDGEKSEKSVAGNHFESEIGVIWTKQMEDEEVGR